MYPSQQGLEEEISKTDSARGAWPPAVTPLGCASLRAYAGLSSLAFGSLRALRACRPCVVTPLGCASLRALRACAG